MRAAGDDGDKCRLLYAGLLLRMPPIKIASTFLLDTSGKDARLVQLMMYHRTTHGLLPSLCVSPNTSRNGTSPILWNGVRGRLLSNHIEALKKHLWVSHKTELSSTSITIDWVCISTLVLEVTLQQGRWDQAAAARVGPADPAETSSVVHLR